ncbi:hypothetical protein [Bosea beijingensis]|uniref:hypothetical protein n=1 Tax=Bosea beijingensis TaxID=3068632 RepID=UPI00274217B2|nr:hypothetical protein [Bosea sp. REN20]
MLIAPGAIAFLLLLSIVFVIALVRASRRAPEVPAQGALAMPGFAFPEHRRTILFGLMLWIFVFASLCRKAASHLPGR